jgi:hypothetical protein
MSYPELAAELKALAALIEKHSAKLEGAALAKSAQSLSKATAALSKKIKDSVAGRSPGLAEFTAQLNGPLAKKHVKGPVLATLHKRVLGKNLPAGLSPVAAKKQFLASVGESELGEKALEELKRLLAELTAVAPVAKDKESLQREFLKLGGLADDDLVLALDTKFKSIALLKALAKANQIPIHAQVTREALLRDVIHFARRAAANVRA